METLLRITLNGEQKEVPGPLSVAELVRYLGLQVEHVAVERNKDLVVRSRHAETPVSEGDVLEVVTLVGGGAAAAQPFEPLKIGTHSFRSRLFVGTGKYSTLELMRDCLEASGAEVVTVAVRRERLFDKEGRNLLDYLDPRSYTILPNTAGCFSAEDALRTARLGRELLEGLGNPGAGWVKLEVLGDTRTLLPDPLATLEATRDAREGGLPGAVLHQRRPDDGPAAQGGRGGQRDAGRQPHRQRPGRAQPQQHPHHPGGPEGGDPDYPVIVDAGVGTASDVTIAMELGCDGVLLEHRHRRRTRPAAHGQRHAAGGRSGLAGSRSRAHPEEALCDGVESDTGCCWAMIACGN